VRKKKEIEERIAAKEKMMEIEKRYTEPNIVARTFCFSHKLTVYPSMQVGTGMMKVFIQHHDKFKPVKERLYDSMDKKEMMEMYAVIDYKYEEFYNKHKERGMGEFTPSY
tara:strand:+ start:512 stop:841 length:330 start_codon:yes stop_codon:yes gene_type:complete